MKRVFKVTTSRPDIQCASSDSEDDSGDGGVKIKSMKRRDSDYNSEDERQRRKVYGEPREPWCGTDEGELDASDGEEFDNVELRFQNSSGKVERGENLPSSDSETSVNLRRNVKRKEAKKKNKKSKNKKKKMTGSRSLDGQCSFTKSSLNCCIVL